MKAAILVTAIVIFTFAEATNANKKGGRGRRIDIPQCATKHTIYRGNNVGPNDPADSNNYQTRPNVVSAKACGVICDSVELCVYWTYFWKTTGSDSNNYGYKTGDCILKSSNTGQLSKRGFHSGYRGCK